LEIRDKVCIHEKNRHYFSRNFRIGARIASLLATKRVRDRNEISELAFAGFLSDFSRLRYLALLFNR